MSGRETPLADRPAAMAGVAPKPKSLFDDFPLFYETGRQSERLGARHECLITDLAHLVRGKNVIDLGSHDGRWTFAAVRAGARHVTGIEPREELIRLAKRNFAAYAVPADNYRLICADGLAGLRRHKLKADTVFVFGVFYHIHRHVDWILEIAKTGAKAVIIDTDITNSQGADDNIVRYKAERVDQIVNAAEESGLGTGLSIVGHPSRPFMSLLFRNTGFRLIEIDWAPYIERWGRKQLTDYTLGKRTTFVATRS